MRLKKVLRNLEVEGQGRGIIVLLGLKALPHAGQGKIKISVHLLRSL